MKKYVPIILCVLISIALMPLCMGYGDQNYPNEYYNVYLDEEFLGTIVSEDQLLKYIEENTKKIINIEKITKTYCEDTRSLEEILEQENLKDIVNESNTRYYTENGEICVDITIENGTEIEKIYTPLGLEIEKVLTYNAKLTAIEEIYSKIVEKKSFTIKGYQFTIAKEDKENYIYVTDKNIFEEAVNKFIEMYVGEEEYKAYLEDTQIEIKTVGSILQNVYIEEDITVKEKQIAIDNTIYTNSDDLAQFLAYGTDPITKKYTVKQGEMISDIAYVNEISTKEFLMSNPKYKSENNLIVAGTEVTIKQTNPQLNVVVEKYIVEDQTNDYKTIYQYDDTQYIGYEKTIQEGEDGLERIAQRQKIINGLLVYAEPKGKETLKAAVDEIVIKGDKYIPNVGDLNNWAWPSGSGWTMNSVSGYDWRIHPVTGERAFHYGLDISGLGYNAPIYSANNGTVIIQEYGSAYGWYVVINHNNGYYTLYAHMNKLMEGLKIGDTVLRGQQIGYVGSTGVSTGPHIHYEVWKGCMYCRISPWSLY